jgi:hypothetical protein
MDKVVEIKKSFYLKSIFYSSGNFQRNFDKNSSIRDNSYFNNNFQHKDNPKIEPPLLSCYNNNKNIPNNLNFVSSLRKNHNLSHGKKSLHNMEDSIYSKKLNKDITFNKSNSKLRKILNNDSIVINHKSINELQNPKVLNLNRDCLKDEKNQFNHSLLAEEPHKKMLRKYIRSMEFTIRASEKDLTSKIIEGKEKEDKDKYDLLCSRQDRKLVRIVSELIENKNRLPKLVSPSRKIEFVKNNGQVGDNKYMGEKYDPLAFYYPLRRIHKRNEFGIPLLN